MKTKLLLAGFILGFVGFEILKKTSYFEKPNPGSPINAEKLDEESILTTSPILNTSPSQEEIQLISVSLFRATQLSTETEEFDPNEAHKRISNAVTYSRRVSHVLFEIWENSDSDPGFNRRLYYLQNISDTLKKYSFGLEDYLENNRERLDPEFFEKAKNLAETMNRVASNLDYYSQMEQAKSPEDLLILDIMTDRYFQVE